MVFHIDTDRRSQIIPWVNYALIALNVLAYLFIDVQRSPGLYLQTHQPLLPQFFSYQFLHNDAMHIFGNMVFLWVFGNHVEERLGHIGYLFFYLASGVLAGVAHVLPVDAPPVIGASGAVAGVTGAFLAFYPLTKVEIDIAFLGEFEVSSLVLILFRIANDAVFSLMGIGNVAYTAHLAGYLFGFVVAMALLLVRFLPREEHDMIGLLHPQPPEARAAADPSISAAERRHAIAAALDSEDPAAAARLYEELLLADASETMPLEPQLEIANQLMREGRYPAAARAYELFLARYPDYGELEQVQLILGLIYAKHLAKPDRARELLTAARPRLSAEDARRAASHLRTLGP